MRVLIVLLLAAVASARLAPLLTSTERIPGRYIVKLKAGHDVGTTINSLGNPKVYYRYNKLFPGFAAQLSDRMVERLRASDAVEYIEEDGIARASSVASWGLDRIDQLALPLDDVYVPIGDGSGVDVYVIDTGINVGHNDYAGRSSNGYDAIGGDGADCNGHGTHCLGTVGGTQYGVAKAANLIGVRVLNCQGSGAYSGVIDGCNWVAQTASGPSVASMSLGGGVSQITDDAIQTMIDAGITVVVAAGNDDNDACTHSPARAENATTVGATSNTDVRASFSNYGTCVDIFAPGVSITSSWIGGSDATNTISGTSMACPHVAGAAAVILGMEPTLTPSEVTDALWTKSIAGAVSNPGTGSPNLLLYIGEGSGGGSPPDPAATIPPLANCGGDFTEASGSFISPYYPLDYANSLSCSYLFSTDGDDVVNVNFNAFDLESASSCQYDVVSIYDGATSASRLIGEFCGTSSPGLVSSSGNDLLIVFESDSSITATGFSATYEMGAPMATPETPISPGACGDVYTEKSGTFASPNFPNNYGSSENCPFTVQGVAKETVTLTFTSFDVENQSSCAYDGVEVYEGSDATGTLLAKLCGTDLPSPITTSGSSMYVRFYSDSSVTYKGFSASYSIA